MQARQRSARQRRVDQATVKRPERPTLLLRGEDTSNISTPIGIKLRDDKEAPPRAW